MECIYNASCYLPGKHGTATDTACVGTAMHGVVLGPTRGAQAHLREIQQLVPFLIQVKLFRVLFRVLLLCRLLRHAVGGMTADDLSVAGWCKHKRSSGDKTGTGYITDAFIAFV